MSVTEACSPQPHGMEQMWPRALLPFWPRCPASQCELIGPSWLLPSGSLWSMNWLQTWMRTSGSFYPFPAILSICHTLTSHSSSCFFTLIPLLAYSVEPNNINYPLVNAHCDRYCCQPCIWTNTISPHKKTMQKAELLPLRNWGTVRSSNSPVKQLVIGRFWQIDSRSLFLPLWGTAPQPCFTSDFLGLEKLSLKIKRYYSNIYLKCER